MSGLRTAVPLQQRASSGPRSLAAVLQAPPTTHLARRSDPDGDPRQQRWWEPHLAKDGAKRGWSVETLGSSHIRFTKPGRKPLVTGPTSTDWRTIKNMRAAIEREQDE
jgi:hypothetical protein